MAAIIGPGPRALTPPVPLPLIIGPEGQVLPIVTDPAATSQVVPQYSSMQPSPEYVWGSPGVSVGYSLPGTPAPSSGAILATGGPFTAAAVVTAGPSPAPAATTAAAAGSLTLSSGMLFPLLVAVAIFFLVRKEA